MGISGIVRSMIGVGILGLATINIGCASEYSTPGRSADLRAVGVTPEMVQNGTPNNVDTLMKKKPLAALPTGIAVVRLQASGYRSQSGEGYGSGKYSVLTTRDSEPEDAFIRLAKMKMVSGIAPINRLLLPENLNSDQELRNAAAQLHADMLLIYTVDTTFRSQDLGTPLPLLTLGLFPDERMTCVATSSAVLLDTRNGYIYGLAEATARNSKLTGFWGNRNAMDDARKRTEAESFEKLVGSIEKMWEGVIVKFDPSKTH